MIFEPISINFSIELSEETFLKILEKDEPYNYRKTLAFKLCEISGVSGAAPGDKQLGPNISATLNLKRPLTETANDIRKTIKEYVA